MKEVKKKVEEVKKQDTTEKKKEVDKTNDVQQGQPSREQIKEINKYVAKRKRALKFIRFFRPIPLMHNCQEAINLLGAQVMVDVQMHVRCPICNARIPINMGNKNQQQVQGPKNSLAPIRKKASKRNKQKK